MDRPWLTWSLPTIGMLFSAWRMMTAYAATGTNVHVHRHAPLLRRSHRRMRVKRREDRRKLLVAGDLLGKVVILAVAIERRLADEAAAFDAPVFLRNRERIFSGDLLNLDAFNVLSVRDDEMRIESRAQKIAIEPNLVSRLRIILDRAAGIRQAIKARHLASVTERDRDRVIDVTRHDERGDDELMQPGFRSLCPFFRLDWSDRLFVPRRGFRLFLTRLAFDGNANEIAGGDSEMLRRGRTEHGSVVPGQFRDRIRQLLEPAVIGITTIVHRVAANEDDFR